MKKLQNNYTTPEQSKRLLELGVPVDSADCIYSEHAYIKYGEVYFDYKDRDLLPIDSITCEQMLYSEYKEKYTNGYILPCWSVGRLIEIYEICRGEWYERGIKTNLVEDLILQIEFELKQKRLDFSKLDD